MFSRVGGYELKEADDGIVVKGYIATTHLDDGFYDESRDLFVRDRISVDTLHSWADQINNGNPKVNKVSVHHNREPRVTGVGIKGTARVDSLPGGDYALYVDSQINKAKDNYEDVKYEVDHGLMDSFSIEFTTKDPLTQEYIEGAVVEEQSGNGIIRTLLPSTELEGWTLASQPMNPHAVMLKEVINHVNEQKELNRDKTIIMEEGKMSEEETKLDETVEEPSPSEEPVKEEAPVEETPAEPVAEEAVKEDVDEKEAFNRFKTYEAKQKRDSELKSIVKEIKSQLSKELDKVEVKEKKLLNKPELGVKEKELKEYNDGIREYKENKDGSIQFKTSMNAQWFMAGKMSDSMGLTVGGLKMDKGPCEAREFKTFNVNGRFLEAKGLGITTNQNTDTDYLLSAAELSDVFDPIIYNALNQATITWSILAKDDMSNKGNNQVQFTLKTAANTTAGAYTGNAVALGNVTRLKYQTKFKKYQAGISVDGDMIAAARGGPIGDVFAREVKDSTDDLMSEINKALFAEVGLETAAGVIGFEYIADSTGNTTMYNLTRSAANRLSPDNATQTYINGASADLAIGNLRKAKRQCLVDGSDINNLVFVGSYIQGDKLRGVYDSLQRLIPTSSRFGFEGRPEFDGIPFFEDKDCNDDDVFLIDLDSHRIAIWVPPTLEMLGKDSDSQKGFIKTYFATYNRAPRRLVMIYGNATS